MTELQNETRSVKTPKVSWIILQILAFLSILYTVAYLHYSASTGTSILDMLKLCNSPILVMPLMALASVAALTAAIFRRPAAPSWVRTTMFWCFYPYLLTLPLILHRLYEISVDIPPSILTRNVKFEYITRIIVQFIPLLVIFITASHILKKQSPSTASDTKPRRQLPAQLIFLTGTLLLALGLLLKLPLFPNVFSSLKDTPYLIAVGTTLVLIAHLRLQRFFLPLAAPAIAAILVSLNPDPFYILLTLERWAPILVLAIVASWLSKAPLRFRIAATAVPAVLLSLSLLSARQTEQANSVLLAQPQPITSTRPADFPPFLEPLPSADHIDYASHTRLEGDYLSLSYRIDDPYPADFALGMINYQLTEAGFDIMYYSIKNPLRPASPITGWSTYRDTQTHPTQLIHEWSANWLNDKNELVSVFLQYQHPYPGPEDLSTLHVTINYFPANEQLLEQINTYNTVRSMEKQ